MSDKFREVGGKLYIGAGVGAANSPFWDLLARLGWASSLHRGAPDYADLNVALARHLDVERLGKPKILKPTSPDLSPPGSLSARYGLREQPYHTDCANWPTPPRYLCLYGLQIDEPVVATTILTPRLNELEKLSELRFGKLWTFQAAGFKGFYGKVLQKRDNGHILRFDPNVMNPFDEAIDAERELRGIGTSESSTPEALWTASTECD